MEAGRELDALVAEKIFGWRWYRWLKVSDLPPEYGGRFINRAGGIAGVEGVDYAEADEAWPLDIHCYAVLPGYSTDISSAWRITERFSYITLALAGVDEWIARLGPYANKVGEARAPDAPHALCLAALAAIGERQPVAAL